MLEPGIDSVPRAERYVRWQAQAIGQLSFAINLFCGFSVAALGFAVSLFREPSFTPNRCYAILFLLSFGLLSLSVVLGVSAVTTRLIDFRLTARKIRLAQREASSEEIEAVGAETKCLGKATWGLFWLLLGSLVLGVAGVVVSVFSVYASRFLDGARP
jgi:hypothetical protein